MNRWGQFMNTSLDEHFGERFFYRFHPHKQRAERVSLHFPFAMISSRRERLEKICGVQRDRKETKECEQYYRPSWIPNSPRW